jgi:RNA polymerase sigma-70 factor, ECF subfamily
VLNYASRLLEQVNGRGWVDRHTAADITQEVFLRAWRHAEVFTEGPGYVRAWLMTVTRNLVVDQIRARASRPPEATDAAVVKGMVATEPDHADRVAASVVVAAAVAQLSEDHRAVLQQVYWKGRSPREAADAMGLSVGTVKSRTHYAMRRLREALGVGGDGR